MPSKGKVLSVQGDFHIRSMKIGKNKQATSVGGKWMQYVWKDFQNKARLCRQTGKMKNMKNSRKKTKHFQLYSPSIFTAVPEFTPHTHFSVKGLVFNFSHKKRVDSQYTVSERARGDGNSTNCWYVRTLSPHQKSPFMFLPNTVPLHLRKQETDVPKNKRSHAAELDPAIAHTRAAPGAQAR